MATTEYEVSCGNCGGYDLNIHMPYHLRANTWGGIEKFFCGIQCLSLWAIDESLDEVIFQPKAIPEKKPDFFEWTNDLTQTEITADVWFDENNRAIPAPQVAPPQPRTWGEVERATEPMFRAGRNNTPDFGMDNAALPNPGRQATAPPNRVRRVIEQRIQELEQETLREDRRRAVQAGEEAFRNMLNRQAPNTTQMWNHMADLNLTNPPAGATITNIPTAAPTTGDTIMLDGTVVRPNPEDTPF